MWCVNCWLFWPLLLGWMILTVLKIGRSWTSWQILLRLTLLWVTYRAIRSQNGGSRGGIMEGTNLIALLPAERFSLETSRWILINWLFLSDFISLFLQLISCLLHNFAIVNNQLSLKSKCRLRWLLLLLINHLLVIIILACNFFLAIDIHTSHRLLFIFSIHFLFVRGLL